MENKTKITFDEFVAIESKLEIKFGFVESVERVPKSYGLKLTVDFGGDDVRTVFTNLGKQYDPEVLNNLTLPFITNLEPTEIKGIKSEAMIMIGKTIKGEDEFEDFTFGTKLL